MRPKVDDIAEDDEDNESNKQGDEGLLTKHSEHEGKHWHHSVEEIRALYKYYQSLETNLKC